MTSTTTVPSIITSSAALWLDSTDLTSITAWSDGTISNWIGKDANQFNFVQSTTTTRPYLTRADSLENRLLQSENLTATWVLVALTSTTTSLIEDNTTNYHYAYQTVEWVKNCIYSYTVRAKQGTNRTWLNINANQTGGGNAYFNLATGSVGTASGVTASIVSVGNGYYDCTITWIAGISSSSARVETYITTGNGAALSYTGVTNNSLNIAASWFRRANTNSQYVKTTTFPVYAGFNGKQRVYFPKEGTVLATSSFTTTLDIGTSNNTIFAVVAKDGGIDSGTNYTYMSTESGNVKGMICRIEGSPAQQTYRTSQSGTMTAYNLTQGIDPVEANILTLVKSGTVAQMYFNGVASLTVGYLANAVSSSSLGVYLGSSTSGSQSLRGYILELLIFNSALTSSQIKAIHRYLSTKHNINIKASREIIRFNFTRAPSVVVSDKVGTSPLTRKILTITRKVPLVYAGNRNKSDFETTNVRKLITVTKKQTANFKTVSTDKNPVLLAGVRKLITVTKKQTANFKAITTDKQKSTLTHASLTITKKVPHPNFNLRVSTLTKKTITVTKKQTANFKAITRDKNIASLQGAHKNIIIDRYYPIVFDTFTMPSGNVLWLDSKTASTIISTTGSISQWQDRSGYLNHFTQSTTANQPILTSASTSNSNRILYSEDLATGWTRGSNAVTASATSMTEVSGVLGQHSYQQTVHLTKGVQYTFTTRLTYVNNPWFAIAIYDAVGSYIAWFNAQTGALGTVQAGITASITSAGGGSYDCSITRTAPYTATNAVITMYMTNNDNTISPYTGTGLGVGCTRMQLRKTNQGTGYVKTINIPAMGGIIINGALAAVPYFYSPVNVMTINSSTTLDLFVGDSTLFVVTQQDSVNDANKHIFIQNNGGLNNKGFSFQISASSDKATIGVYDGSAHTLSDSTAFGITPQIHTAAKSSFNVTIRQDRTADGSATLVNAISAGSNTIQLGGDGTLSGLCGYLLEVMAFNRKLNSTEITHVEDFLAARWQSGNSVIVGLPAGKRLTVTKANAPHVVSTSLMGPVPYTSLYWDNMVHWAGSLKDWFAANKIANPPYGQDPALTKAYYDGLMCAYRIKDYVGGTTYDQWINDERDAYLNYYVLDPAVGGNVTGFQNFTEGLYNDFSRTTSYGTASRDAIDLILKHGAYVPYGDVTDDLLSRECAYALKAFIHATRAGISLTAGETARMATLLDAAIGHIDQWVSLTADYFRPFMGGITAHALIYYYLYIAQDSRIIPSLTSLANFAWNTCWRQTGSATGANPSTTQRYGQGLAFTYTSVTNINNDLDWYTQPDLNMLICPLYGFLWWKEGNPVWRQRGDLIFQGGISVYQDGFYTYGDGTYPYGSITTPPYGGGAYMGSYDSSNPSGKQYDQQLVWGPLYLDWATRDPGS